MSDLKLGDKIRILQEGHNCARVFKGDILEIVDGNDITFETEAPRLEHIVSTWTFNYQDEGYGWEKYEGEK